MKKIFKYPLEITDSQEIHLSPNCQLLSVQIQNGAPTLWAMVDPDARMFPVTVYVIGTGNPVPSEVNTAIYVDTVQLNGFVWHVFVNPPVTPIIAGDLN